MQLAGLSALFLGSVALAADVGDGLRVHNLFQSNMVIQRSKPIDVWGWSTPGDRITVTFAGKTATAACGGGPAML